MTTLISLPNCVLEEIFRQINQHQALALAPLHSDLYKIAKTKLYHNIFIYRSSQLGNVLVGPTGELVPEFRFHKTINNLKSNSYTIISTNTLEKYMARMEKDQLICHFEILDCNFMLLECIVRHFRFIKTLEIPRQTWNLGSRAYFECLQTYMTTTRPDTFFLPHRRPCYHTPMKDDGMTKLEITYWQLAEHFEFVEQLHTIEELILIFFTIQGLGFKPSLNFRKLTLSDLPSNFSSYISDAFDVKWLLELTVLGGFSPSKLFKSRQFNKEFPNLIQLCILLGPKISLQGIQDLQGLRHPTLKTFNVATFECNQKLADAVCSLRILFPIANIHWYSSENFRYGPQWDILSVFSPHLPIDAVGCHMKMEHAKSVTNMAMKVRLESGKSIKMRLHHCYSDAEIDQLLCIPHRLEYDWCPRNFK